MVATVLSNHYRLPILSRVSKNLLTTFFDFRFRSWFRLLDTNLEREVRAIVVIRSKYAVRKSTYSYNTKKSVSCIFVALRATHFESCSSWKKPRPLVDTFAPTSATIIDDDTVFDICRRPCCLRCSTSLSHEICSCILNSKQSHLKNWLIS